MKKDYSSTCCHKVFLFLVLIWSEHFHFTSVYNTKPAGQQRLKYLNPSYHHLLPFSSHPSSHLPCDQARAGAVPACLPGSPERCRSAACSDSPEDPPHYSPPRCRSERHEGRVMKERQDRKQRGRGEKTVIKERERESL